MFNGGSLVNKSCTAPPNVYDYLYIYDMYKYIILYDLYLYICKFDMHICIYKHISLMYILNLSNSSLKLTHLDV